MMRHAVTHTLAHKSNSLREEQKNGQAFVGHDDDVLLSEHQGEQKDFPLCASNWSILYPSGILGPAAAAAAAAATAKRTSTGKVKRKQVPGGVEGSTSVNLDIRASAIALRKKLGLICNAHF